MGLKHHYTTHTTTYWEGIDPNTNFCPNCGCSVNYNTFTKKYRDKNYIGVIYFLCNCSWEGNRDKFVDYIKSTQIQRKNKIEKIEDVRNIKSV